MEKLQPVVIDYVVIDGNGGSDSSTLTITVTGTNDGPTAVADLGGTNEGASATFDVLANDTDPDAGDSLSITSALITTGSGSVSIVSDEIVYDPGTSYDFLADGETATVIVDYTISDGNGGTDSAQLTITVTGTNDGPVAVADINATTENASVTTDVIANDTDVDTTDVLALQTASAVLNYATLDSDSSAITITDATVTQSGNNVTFNPGSDFEFLAVGETATVVIDYVAIDGNGGTDNSTLTITVTGTNDGPVAVVDANSTDETQRSDDGRDCE